MPYLGVRHRQLRAEVEAAATCAAAAAPGKSGTLPEWAFRLHDDTADPAMRSPPVFGRVSQQLSNRIGRRIQAHLDPRGDARCQDACAGRVGEASR